MFGHFSLISVTNKRKELVDVTAGSLMSPNKTVSDTSEPCSESFSLASLQIASEEECRGDTGSFQKGPKAEDPVQVENHSELEPSHPHPGQ